MPTAISTVSELIGACVRGGVEDDRVAGVCGDQLEHVAEQADEVLPGRDGADRPGEDVVEHQRADRELGQRCRRCASLTTR